MPNVEREFAVQLPQHEVWRFVRDMGNWATQMPGYVSHEVLGDDDSAWTVQFNMGPFTRPCIVEVHVERWGEPSEVEFTIKGRFDPFQGRGAFRSTAAPAQTQVRLQLEVEGTGAMAKVISAMAAPVLPTVAEQFAANLQGAMNASAPDATPPAGPPVRPRPFLARVLSAIRALFGARNSSKSS